MLEKIGLPAKPSFRGNNWVVDSSHCQGCSSQFTFINRKHHCRRCGGLFCNSCTQQRMVLRGQGDSPVRICDPCKKLEEAARFELRHGHRTRAGKGSSRSAPKNEDEVLAQILASDTKGSSSSRSSYPDQEDSTLDRTASASSFSEESSTTSALSEMGSSTPEELRQQASDEKNKYRVLKGERKPEEALKAFKRGKELERQADALELYLRKNRKKAAFPAGNMSENPNPNPTGDGSTKSRRQNRSRGGTDTGKDDLMSELKELGWSEADLHTEEKKSGNMSIEGELSTLLGEVSDKTNINKGNRGIGRTEVTAHKRKALLLKREGKLAEAKEELKKAKLLEKQAEEQEILGGAGDSSDDEFSDLIRSMDENKQENFSSAREHNHFNGLIGVGNIDNIGADLNFEVTEEDMEDPDLSATLKSLGWAEESNQNDGFPSVSEVSRENRAARVSNAPSSSAIQGPSATVVQKPRRSKAEIQRELLGLKRKALTLRREGMAEEAEEVLKAAKGLEDEIAELDAPKDKPTRIEPPVNSSVEEVNEEEEVTENDLQDPSLLGMLKDLGWKDEEQQKAVKLQDQSSRSAVSDPSEIVVQSKGAIGVPRSKAKIQRELLGLKRKALELRRKGEIDEAEEILRQAKVLEAEMEELEAASRVQEPIVSEEKKAESLRLVAANDIAEDAVKARRVSSIPERIQSIGTTETLMEELSVPANRAQGNASVQVTDLLTGDDDWTIPQVHDQKPVDKMDSAAAHPLAHPNTQNSPVKSSPEKEISAEKRPQVLETNVVQETAHQKALSPLKQEILEHKKRAVALKREGRLAEAREELKRAKLLEKSLDEGKPQPQPSVTLTSSSSTVPSVREKEQDPSAPAPKQLSGRERFKIQQESLGHKRQALKLRKEGRIQEAEAEFELAKALEAQLEESGPNDTGKSSSERADDVGVEDLLDPELMSALRAIGIEGPSTASQIPDKPKPEPVKVNAGRSDNSSSSNKERSQLEEEIRAEKVKALNLKRSGKQGEALDALRRAKLLEKKLDA
ncbi:uncharacterized protein LOC116192533 [Punica granatum]|uniref:FYVE-type domain-containing protein n=2 Tax=Punica granatum TaxID=22663 RepID=A0A218VSH1_PUNGR|nr:uncharacterized protein LOC116192533 [Punica granatum]OWM63306.1 hypothetical protein CDL15_Pgr022051 [Punica granatum]PKI70050.1 hypothetical protein CRG98_009513 [Punica granatum]